MENDLVSEESYNNVITSELNNNNNEKIYNNNTMIIEDEFDIKSDKLVITIKKTREIKKIMNQYFLRNNKTTKNSKSKNKKIKVKKE